MKSLNETETPISSIYVFSVSKGNSLEVVFNYMEWQYKSALRRKQKQKKE